MTLQREHLPSSLQTCGVSTPGSVSTWVIIPLMGRLTHPGMKCGTQQDNLIFMTEGSVGKVPNISTSLLWNKPSVHCEDVLLSLVNKELTCLELGRKRMDGRARQREGGWREESPADAERCSKMVMPY